jgi:endonuclease/exonuclease/phosphatase (EEP) superfamily protein YafD
MAEAFKNASAATGSDIAKGSVLMFGDFNEFEWASATSPFCPFILDLFRVMPRGPLQ